MAGVPSHGTAQTWDTRGNPTTYQGATLTFDEESRCTAVGTLLTSGYRGDGLRAWKQAGSTRTYFLYDGDTPVIELSSAGAVTATNTFGAAGLLSRRTGSSSTFYQFDPQGSVVQRLNSSGTPQTNYCPDAWGVRSSSGAPATDPWVFGAQWGYFTDRETGLLLLTHRFYDPGTGRFLNRDPIGYAGGVNLYGYTENRPTNATDPSGYSTLLEKILAWITAPIRIIHQEPPDLPVSPPLQTGPPVEGPPPPPPPPSPYEMAPRGGSPPPVPQAPEIAPRVPARPFGPPPKVIGTPRGGFGGPIRGASGGYRSSGSGGGVGAIVTIGYGAGVLAEGAAHTFHWKRRIQRAENRDPYAPEPDCP